MDTTGILTPASKKCPDDVADGTVERDMDVDGTQQVVGQHMVSSSEKSPEATRSSQDAFSLEPGVATGAAPKMEHPFERQPESAPGLVNDDDDDNDDDVVMAEAGDSSGEDVADESDDYEPPESIDAEGSKPSLPRSTPNSVEGGNELEGGLESVDVPAAAAVSSPAREVERKATQPLPQAEHLIMKQGDDEEEQEVGKADKIRSEFVPYETPLQYFRSYRFHPEFSQKVAGGLRSLTYSNRIDVQKALCPDDLVGRPCPRGSDCEFQHFQEMKARGERLPPLYFYFLGQPSEAEDMSPSSLPFFFFSVREGGHCRVRCWREG